MDNNTKIQHSWMWELKPAGYNIISVENLYSVEIEVPPLMEQYILTLLQEEDLNPGCSVTHLRDRIICSMDWPGEDTRSYIQELLMERQIPHSFFLEDQDNHWVRADFRWVNGKYMTYRCYSEDDMIPAANLCTYLEKQAYTALQIYVNECRLRNACIPFTDEDIQFCQPRALDVLVRETTVP